MMLLYQISIVSRIRISILGPVVGDETGTAFVAVLSLILKNRLIVVVLFVLISDFFMNDLVVHLFCILMIVMLMLKSNFYF